MKRLFLLVLLALTGCITPSPVALSPTIPTIRPSATTLPTVTPRPTAAPSPTPAAPDELALYRRAMRPHFAGDIDRFANATRYWIDLEVYPSEKTLEGAARVRYTNLESAPLDEIVFRLLPNTPGYQGTLTITRITLEGAPAEADLSQGGSTLTLPLPQALAPGEAVEIELAYEGALPTAADAGYAQYGLYDGVLALPDAYPMIPVYDEEGWNAEVAPPHGDATFADTALYVVRVTLPSEMTAAASGVLVNQQAHAGGRTTFTYATGPMRGFIVVGSAEYASASTKMGEVMVHSFYREGNRAGGERALDYAAYALRLYEEIIGPYPFTELDVAATPTLAGGIEYPGLIVIADDLYGQQGGFFELVAVHEVAHQWWYSLVGNDQIDEPWLDEALAQYTSLLYYEARYGPDRARQFLQGTFAGPYRDLVDTGRDMPAGLPVRDYTPELYGPVVYGKGPLYLDALRTEIGQEAFAQVLQTYFRDHRYGIAYPSDWLAAVAEVTGKPYDELYATWISGE